VKTWGVKEQRRKEQEDGEDKKLPLTRFLLSTLRSTATEDGSAFPISAFQPALAAETSKLERTLSDLVNQA